MSARILAVDVESSPAKLWGYGLFNQNFALKQIIEPGRIISWGWRWTDEGPSKCVYRWADDDGAWEELWDKLDEATHIVTYNGKRFDQPYINAESKRLGVRGGKPYSPFKHIDLYQEAKRNFRTLSGKLQYVSTDLLGFEGKLEANALDLWLEMQSGDPNRIERARRKFERYCKQDVNLLPKMLDEMRPWIRGLNLNLYRNDTTEEVCPNCESSHFQRRGYAYTTTSRYPRMRCNDCGTWFRGRHSDGVTATRNVT